MTTAPHVHAAGVIPVHPSGMVLLQLRDDRAEVGSPNRWGMLGGMLEAGESPEEAALREMDEEVGRRPAVLHHYASGDHASLRRPGVVVRSHVYGAAVDWTLDDLILGEGQRLDWFTRAAVPHLPLVLPLAPLLLGFLGSAVYARLSGNATASPPSEPRPLPPGLPALLGLRPGQLLAVHGIGAGLIHRLWETLDSIRITASPGEHERPDTLLWRPRHESPSETLAAWRARLAPGGTLWVMQPSGGVQTLTAAARTAGFSAGASYTLTDGAVATRFVRDR